MEISTFEVAKKYGGFSAGDIVTHSDFGRGIIVGFSSVSSNAVVFFYNPSKEYKDMVICVCNDTLILVR